MHTFITYVADRAATREVEALSDFYAVGQLIVSRELTYEAARDQMVEAYKARSLAGSTAKVYVSQGFALAQLFDTLADVEAFADEDCDGSRSLKRIYDATRVKDEPAATDGEAEAEAAIEAPAMALVDVILAGLANLTDAAEIARVRDAAIAKLALAVAA